MLYMYTSVFFGNMLLVIIYLITSFIEHNYTPVLIMEPIQV